MAHSLADIKAPRRYFRYCDPHKIAWQRLQRENPAKQCSAIYTCILTVVQPRLFRKLANFELNGNS